MLLRPPNSTSHNRCNDHHSCHSDDYYAPLRTVEWGWGWSDADFPRGQLGLDIAWWWSYRCSDLLLQEIGVIPSLEGHSSRMSTQMSREHSVQLNRTWICFFVAAGAAASRVSSYEAWWPCVDEGMVENLF